MSAVGEYMYLADAARHSNVSPEAIVDAIAAKRVYAVPSEVSISGGWILERSHVDAWLDGATATPTYSRSTYLGPDEISSVELARAIGVTRETILAQDALWKPRIVVAGHGSVRCYDRERVTTIARERGLIP